MRVVIMGCGRVGILLTQELGLEIGRVLFRSRAGTRPGRSRTLAL